MANTKNKIPIYNANNVRANFWNWFYFLENIAFNVFEYENLPGNIPPQEIERRLIEWGYVCVYRDSRAGLVAVTGSLYGFDMYDMPTDFTMTNPVLGTKQLKLGLNAAVIYSDSNSFRQQSTALQTICKYARLLAESTSTIAVASRNNRAPVWAVAQDEQTKASVKSYFDKLAEGEPDIVCTNNAIFDTFKGIPATAPNAGNINDNWQSLENALKGFYRDYGIRYLERKNERLITDEINAQDEVLFTNILDMYRNRQQGIERINNLFGTNIKVSIANGLKRGVRNDID